MCLSRVNPLSFMCFKSFFCILKYKAKNLTRRNEIIRSQSIAKKLTFSEIITPFRFFSKLAGFWYYDMNFSFSYGVEIFYFLMNVVFYSIMLINIEENILKKMAKFFHIKHLIFSYCLQFFVLAPFFSFVKIKFQNKKFKLLVTEFETLFENMCKEEKQKFTRCSYFVIIMMIFHLVLVMLRRWCYQWFYQEITFFAGPYFAFSFAWLNELWIIIPYGHFIVWTILFKMMVKKTTRNLIDCINLIPNGMNWRSFGYEQLLNRCIKTIKCLLKIKVILTDVYGFSVIVSLFYIFYTLSYRILLLISQGLVFINAFRILIIGMNFVLMITLFWIAETASKDVKKSLNMIHNLVITQHWSVKDKQLRNFSMSFLHEDLTFRVCDLVDLTYKQLLSITSIAVAFLVIQLQLQM